VSEEDTRRPAIIENAPRVREFRRFFRVFFNRGVVVFGVVIILFFIIAAIFAPWLAPYNPDKIDMNNALQIKLT